MKLIVYALILAVVNYPLWVIACWACMEGPLQHLAIPHKMAVGSAVSVTAIITAMVIWSAIYLGEN